MKESTAATMNSGDVAMAEAFSESPAPIPDDDGVFLSAACSPSSPPPRDVRNLYASAMAYNIITLTDGALRAIVLLFLVQLQFSAITLAVMFSLYEVMGVFMNFFGGIVGATYGMRFLVFASAFGQFFCVVLLAPLQVVFPDLENADGRNTTLITFYVIVGQMLSGVSKDLMKIQGKSMPKLVTKVGDEDRLFKLISFITGMKNSIKGFGYLFGSLLLFYVGWVGALCIQGGLLLPIFFMAGKWMERDLGISEKTRRRGIRWDAFRKGWNVNVLSGARFFLFGSRDVWFEIAAPYFMRAVLMWAPFAVGGFMAGYTIVYGQLQIATQQLFPRALVATLTVWMCCVGRSPTLSRFWFWVWATTWRTFTLSNPTRSNRGNRGIAGGHRGVCRAVCREQRCALVFNRVYSDHDKVAMDVGFYYCSNAGGRMVGTLISGFIYTYTVDEFGISVNLWVSAGFLLVSAWVLRFCGMKPSRMMKGRILLLNVQFAVA
ncbi:hypothetical protein BASA81_006242 [Batrachochytrium salamandrivorans]|nr:hypothetical protein BASA81_006242 [Batrachochytrium salamandrivorans]